MRSIFPPQAPPGAVTFVGPISLIAGSLRNLDISSSRTETSRCSLHRGLAGSVADLHLMDERDFAPLSRRLQDGEGNFKGSSAPAGVVHVGPALPHGPPQGIERVSLTSPARPSLNRNFADSVQPVNQHAIG